MWKQVWAQQAGYFLRMASQEGTSTLSVLQSHKMSHLSTCPRVVKLALSGLTLKT